MTDYDALEPTEPGEAFQAMTMEPGDNQWYMDTGASSHLTADQGKIIQLSQFCRVTFIIVDNGKSCANSWIGQHHSHTVFQKPSPQNYSLYTTYYQKLNIC